MMKFSPSWSTITSLILQCAKPDAAILTMYVPGGTVGKVKAPLLSDEEVRVDLDVTSSSVTRALGMAAWSVSVMVPVIVPEVVASGDCWAAR
jgi:hypothetical protein